MPKMKSNRGAAKRFKRSGSGGYKRAHAFKNHILTKRTPKNKRQLRGTTQVDDRDRKAVSKLLPYS